ncbi:MAG: FHA domain-containing protein [Verrucomicrobiota bacterium]
MPRLVILSEGLTGRAHELKVEKTTIGRVDDNTFPIGEASVSSHHCEILLRGSEIVLRDLNSTNGTFINGQQLTGEAVLKPGQIIRLGQVEMRLEDAGAKPPASKKLPDQTMVIPQGVKLGQDTSTKIVAFDNAKNGFAKKNDMGTKIFIAVAALVFLVLIAVIIILVKKAG